MAMHQVATPEPAPDSPSRPPREDIPTPVADGSSLVVPDVHIERMIACTAMSVVYKGVQRFLNRPVAVKVLPKGNRWDAQFTERFQREARLLAELNHENIVTCYLAGQLADGRVYMVMEYVDGPNLSDYVVANGPLGERAALEFTRDVAMALAHASERGIVHRDVKPQNVLLKPITLSASARGALPYVLKLADLGIARYAAAAADVGEGANELTRMGQFVGTPSYMAPEQFDDAASVDHRADIYALGGVLYFLLSGVTPFASKSMGDLVRRKLAGHLPTLRAMDRPVRVQTDSFVTSLMAPDPEMRIGSFAEVLDQCNALIATFEDSIAASITSRSLRPTTQSAASPLAQPLAPASRAGLSPPSSPMLQRSVSTDRTILEHPPVQTSALAASRLITEVDQATPRRSEPPTQPDPEVSPAESAPAQRPPLVAPANAVAPAAAPPEVAVLSPVASKRIDVAAVAPPKKSKAPLIAAAIAVLAVAAGTGIWLQRRGPGDTTAADPHSGARAGSAQSAAAPASMPFLRNPSGAAPSTPPGTPAAAGNTGGAVASGVPGDSGSTASLSMAGTGPAVGTAPKPAAAPDSSPAASTGAVASASPIMPFATEAGSTAPAGAGSDSQDDNPMHFVGDAKNRLVGWIVEGEAEPSRNSDSGVDVKTNAAAATPSRIVRRIEGVPWRLAGVIDLSQSSEATVELNAFDGTTQLRIRVQKLGPSLLASVERDGALPIAGKLPATTNTAPFIVSCDGTSIRAGFLEENLGPFPIESVPAAVALASSRGTTRFTDVRELRGTGQPGQSVAGADTGSGGIAPPASGTSQPDGQKSLPTASYPGSELPSAVDRTRMGQTVTVAGTVRRVHPSRAERAPNRVELVDGQGGEIEVVYWSNFAAIYTGANGPVVGGVWAVRGLVSDFQGRLQVRADGTIPPRN